MFVSMGAAIISLSPALVKVSGVGPVVSGFYRTLIGGLTLAVVLLVSGRRFRLWEALLDYVFFRHLFRRVFKKPENEKFLLNTFETTKMEK